MSWLSCLLWSCNTIMCTDVKTALACEGEMSPQAHVMALSRWHCLGKQWNLSEGQPHWRKWIPVGKHWGFTAWPHFLLPLASWMELHYEQPASCFCCHVFYIMMEQPPWTIDQNKPLCCFMICTAVERNVLGPSGEPTTTFLLSGQSGELSSNAVSLYS